MSEKDREVWVNIVVPEETAKLLKQIAKRENRSRGRQGALLLEMGLAEYESHMAHSQGESRE